MFRYSNFGKILQSGLHGNYPFPNSLPTIRWMATVTTDVNQFKDSELAAAKPFEEIPCIPSLPIIGSAWIYMPLIGRYKLSRQHLADRHKHAVYGDIVREKIGSLNIVHSFVPETMEIFYKHEGRFPARAEFSTIKAYREYRKEWYKTAGVLILQGKDWWDLRSKIQKHMMKPKTIQSYLFSMQEVANDFVKRIYSLRDNNNEVPHFLEELHKWSLESAAFVGLDTRLGCLNSNLQKDSEGTKMIESVQTQFYCINRLEAFTGNIQFWKYFPTPTWKKFVKASDVFSEIAFKYINRALESLKEDSLEDKELTMLQSMLLTKGLDVSGAMVTAADMLMAGINATSNTVGFFLYHLAKNPDKQQLLYEEIKKLLPNKNDKITPTTFGELRYLKSCLKEALRLNPIVRGNTRILDHDVVICGYRIPAETVIFCLLQVIYRDEKYFKDAHRFKPERWLSKDEKLTNPYAYLPFGSGVRSCVGRRLAELEMICVATEILRNFKVEYHYEDIGVYTRIDNCPDKPLKFNFIER